LTTKNTKGTKSEYKPLEAVLEQLDVEIHEQPKPMS